MRLPSFGVCTTTDHAPALRDAGFDFIEAGVVAYLSPATSDADYRRPTSDLPVPVCNLFLPRDVRVVGPTRDVAFLERYCDTACRRAAGVGVKVLVFGAGRARQIMPDDDPAACRHDLADTLRLAADAAGRHDVKIALEHLNTSECNHVTTFAEALALVRTLAHPALGVLADSYHLWREDESPDVIHDAGNLLLHVHLADRDGRTAPGTGGPAAREMYPSFFAALKKVGYPGLLSIEAPGASPESLASARAFVNEVWPK